MGGANGEFLPKMPDMGSPMNPFGMGGPVNPSGMGGSASPFGMGGSMNPFGMRGKEILKKNYSKIISWI